MVGLKRKELAGRRFTRIVSVGGGAKKSCMATNPS